MLTSSAASSPPSGGGGGAGSAAGATYSGWLGWRIMTASFAAQSFFLLTPASFESRSERMPKTLHCE